MEATDRPNRDQIKHLESELQRVAKEQWAKHPNNPAKKAPFYCRDPEHCNGSCRREIACNH